MLPAIIPALIGLAAEAAPVIARVFGGEKSGQAAQAVVDTALEVTGELTQADAAHKLRNNPEAYARFRTALLDQQEAILRIHARDRSDARALTRDLAAAGHGAAWGSVMVSAIVTLGFFVMLGLVMGRSLPAGSEPIANILLGSLAAGFTQVLNFWLGSSRSSQDKTTLLKAKTP